MTDIMEKREKWFQEYYGQLEGYTISKFDGMKDTDGVGEDGFANFILHKERDNYIYRRCKR
jgi:hypothetical protein